MENVEKIEHINVHYTATLRADINYICKELDIDRKDIQSYDITHNYELEIILKDGDILTHDLEGYDEHELGYVQDCEFLDNEYNLVEVE
jgi:hypothetical protein